MPHKFAAQPLVTQRPSLLTRVKIVTPIASYERTMHLMDMISTRFLGLALENLNVAHPSRSAHRSKPESCRAGPARTICAQVTGPPKVLTTDLPAT